MSETSIVYLNGDSLSTATAVFKDASLTSCADDGFYSDGNIVRQQVGCVLLPEVQCPSCVTPCESADINGDNKEAIYLIDVDTKDNIGAIVIRFTPTQDGSGIRSILGSAQYRKLSSQFFGVLDGLDFSYVGDSSSSCIQLSPYPYDGEVAEYQNGSFVPNGDTTSYTVPSSDYLLTPIYPGVCTMVIPKQSVSFSIVKTEIRVPCAGTATPFHISIECPQLLPSWSGSENNGDFEEACLSGVNNTYYYVHVNGAGGVLGLFDFVFEDQYGALPLADGYYNTGSMSPSYSYVKVENGVVTTFGLCPTPQFFTVEMCFSKITKVISAPSSLPIESVVSVVGFPGCIWKVVATTTGPSNATFGGMVYGIGCDDQCSRWAIKNNTAIIQSVSMDMCETGDSATIDINPNTEVLVCAKDIDPVQDGIDVTFVSCGCGEYPYLIESCLEPGVFLVVNGPSGLGVGTLVQASGYPNCWWQVITEEKDPGLFVITNINTDPNFDCSKVCGYYKLCNETIGAQSINFIGCSGIPNNLVIPPGQCSYVCARNSSFSESQITITLQSCLCPQSSSNYLVRRCNDFYTEVVAIPGSVSIGSHVYLDGYPGCVWEVLSLTNNPATAAFVATATGCDAQCATWLLLNNDSEAQIVGYIDCEGFPQTVTITGGQSQSICARYISEPSPQVTAQIATCNCIP